MNSGGFGVPAVSPSSSAPGALKRRLVRRRGYIHHLTVNGQRNLDGHITGGNREKAERSEVLQVHVGTAIDSERGAGVELPRHGVGRVDSQRRGVRQRYGLQGGQQVRVESAGRYD